MKKKFKLQASNKTVKKKTYFYWQNYIDNQNNRGHAERSLTNINLLTHINDCLNSSFETISRIKIDTNNFKPNYILEIGSSAGAISLQAKQLYPNSTVLGLEPEKEAVLVSKTMSNDFNLNNLFFVNGVGENLPFRDEQFDLIICHTVIEHVNNVEVVLSEMKRVLSPRGFIHLEAPNYNWPYEPHLAVWCLPRLGKTFVKLLTKMQKNKTNIEFLNHLQFVHPSHIEKKLNQLSMKWDNLFIKKVHKIANGDTSSVKQYIKLSKILKILNLLGLNKFLIQIITTLKIYPSLMYLIYKNHT